MRQLQSRLASLPHRRLTATAASLTESGDHHPTKCRMIDKKKRKVRMKRRSSGNVIITHKNTTTTEKWSEGEGGDGWEWGGEEGGRRKEKRMKGRWKRGSERIGIPFSIHPEFSSAAHWFPISNSGASAFIRIGAPFILPQLRNWIQSIPFHPINWIHFHWIQSSAAQLTRHVAKFKFVST